MTLRAEGPAGEDGAERMNLEAVNKPYITSLAAEQARIRFGKYRGRSFRWLILRRPEYAGWLVREQDSLIGPALKDLPHLEEAIFDFDDAPIVETCNAYGCSKPAVWCTAFQGNPSIVEFTCSDHEPAIAWSCSWGICSYTAALAYAEGSCGGNSRAYRKIILRIAEAKVIPLPRDPRP